MPPPAPEPIMTASYCFGCFFIWRSPMPGYGFVWWNERVNLRVFSLVGRLVADGFEFGTRLPIWPVMAKGQVSPDSIDQLDVLQTAVEVPGIGIVFIGWLMLVQRGIFIVFF